MRESGRSRFDKAQELNLKVGVKATRTPSSTHCPSNDSCSEKQVISMSRMDDALRSRICIADESWILDSAVPRRTADSSSTTAY